MEIPVYIFTGFLDSGKTTFIQDVLEGEDFNAGEKTLFLLCEKGETDYHPARFFGTSVYFERIRKESEFTPEFLDGLVKKYDAERVIVEYNGMWTLDALYQNMPQNWLTYQEMAFFDARTFLSYNQNMRQQVYDKLQSAEMIVFNRCEHGFDKMPLHKIVRAANRRVQILYEYGPDDVEMDDIVDPLPFDINAPLIEIKDRDYAEWYRDINENQDNYDGKTIQVRGRAVLGGELPEGTFVFGRHLMTCCEADIQFAGLVYKMDDCENRLSHGGWFQVTATIKVEYNDVYGEVGPVFYCSKVMPCKEAVPEVAQF